MLTILQAWPIATGSYLRQSRKLNLRSVLLLLASSARSVQFVARTRRCSISRVATAVLLLETRSIFLLFCAGADRKTYQ